MTLKLASDLAYVIITAAIVVAMISWATYLLFKRLRSYEPKMKSFREWVRNILEAIWGI